MAEKKMNDLPPSYSNLSYDSAPVAGPSAPQFREEPKYEGHFRGNETDPSEPPPELEPGPGQLVYNPPNLVFEDIYEACVKYAGEHCCYGKGFLNQMKLIDVTNKAVFYYKLESIGEKRESEAKSFPYRGEPVDGSENGRPPEPWNVTVLPPDLFNDCHITTNIPHTDVVRTCPKCNGIGDQLCDSCGGRGHLTCTWCKGSGREMWHKNCSSCGGDGLKICWSCLGAKKITCLQCSGYMKIKDWTVLNVTWKNHVNEYISDTRGNLPIDRIRKAKGVEVFQKEDTALEPITNAPDATVNTASARMLESHLNSFRNERIIRQRHTLRAVPLTQVRYQWNDEDGEFYVYDTDRKAYFKYYPQPFCCCTCS